MATRIVFNGREYASLEEMPADVRLAYDKVMGLLADKDQDGVPDIMQQAGGANVVVNQASFTVNGQQYSSLEEMPDEVRKVYERAMGLIGSGGGSLQPSVDASAGVKPAAQSAAPLLGPSTRAPQREADDEPTGFGRRIAVLLVALLAAIAWMVLR
jgi:hypothetical protein